MTVQLAKGVKDYNFKEMILRQELIRKLTTVFERYGFSPFETPIIERYDVLASKFGAGEDSDAAKEIFRLSDQGERNLGLRFELTLSMCRFIAMNPTIKLPFKRYEIGRVYRDGPIKLGRMREFTQCDVDIVGTKSMIADAEIIKLGLDALKELGLDSYIEINNRKILKGLLNTAKIPENKKTSAIIILDKLKKIGRDGVIKELKNIGINEKKSSQLLESISSKDSFEKNVEILKTNMKDDEGLEGIKEIEELFSYLSYEDKKNVVFNISLARGLSYYTGTIFEGFLRNSKIKSSICGGGRYNEMIGKLMNTNNQYPALGISFGLVPILEALNLEKKEDLKEIVTDIFVIPLTDTIKESVEVVRELRYSGISADIDLMNRNIGKNMKYANSMSIPFVMIIGEDEIRSKKYKLKNMISGEEKSLTLKDIIKTVKK